jgi:hypothetical protein
MEFIVNIGKASAKTTFYSFIFCFWMIIWRIMPNSVPLQQDLSLKKLNGDETLYHSRQSRADATGTGSFSAEEGAERGLQGDRQSRAYTVAQGA